MASDTCNRSGTATYDVQIALDPAVPDGLSISNFWDAFLAPVRASLSDGVITIDRQDPDADSFFIMGTGEEDSTGVLSVEYRVTDETDPAAIIPDICVSTWTKQ